MFTGIVTDIGEALKTEQTDGLRARIGTSYDVHSIDIGASIACDGICLTVVAVGEKPQPWFEVEVSAETVSKTNIGRSGWPAGKRINLERALRVGDELGGHIVSGHVDDVAEVVSISSEGNSTRVALLAPKACAGLIASKGSIALNGTSLTVNEVKGREFDVNLIPHTKAVTNWGDIAVGDTVNLEVDTIARYAARLREWG